MLEEYVNIFAGVNLFSQVQFSKESNYEIISKKVFGVTEKNFYSEYKNRWMKYSYWETVKDPYYISKKFSYFPEIENLKDIGVLGLTIKKLI